MLRKHLNTLLLIAALIIFTLGYDSVADLEGLNIRSTIMQLLTQHTLLVVASGIISIIIGVGLALVSDLVGNRDFTTLLIRLGQFGDTFPTVAVIALLIPVFGYGYEAVLVALCMYGILPILKSTIAGFESVDANIIESAKGMGFSKYQILLRIKLPLAKSIILSGIRISLVINVAVASIGAAMGAGGLGGPILDGIRKFNAYMILRGAVPVSLLALVIDSIFRNIEAKVQTEE